MAACRPGSDRPAVPCTTVERLAQDACCNVFKTPQVALPVTVTSWQDLSSAASGRLSRQTNSCIEEAKDNLSLAVTMHMRRLPRRRHTGPDGAIPAAAPGRASALQTASAIRGAHSSIGNFSGGSQAGLAVSGGTDGNLEWHLKAHPPSKIGAPVQTESAQTQSSSASVRREETRPSLPAPMYASGSMLHKRLVLAEAVSCSAPVQSCGERKGSAPLILPTQLCTQVVITGNARTRTGLVGQHAMVHRSSGLGGWHWLILNLSQERVKVSLVVLLHPPAGYRVLSLTLVLNVRRCSAMHSGSPQMRTGSWRPHVSPSSWRCPCIM